MLLADSQKGHLAHKNFCFKTHSDNAMVVNVSVQGMTRSTLWV